MQVSSQLRSRLARDLRYALGAQEFEVYYQTIVELKSGHIHKAEALLRWKHPELGFISPAVFIPIAENTGTINYIGDWVFMQAAKQVKHLQSVLNRDFQISINKSPVQFKVDTPCHELWIKWLSEMDLPGSSIAIEITEGLLMDAESKVKDKLLSFRDAGIQVSIDDFGTGYSALSYLKKFDIDYLKIDQSFTKNLAPDSQDLALCEAIVVMAHKLGIKVIAEGVETEQQHDLLIKMGCDYGQGYLFSRPIPAVEFEKILAIG
jgi:EAL domain-containing protein (putative c-di-GMP-specific phosphodiesterase class I)